jgi:SlyX protein
MTEELIELQMQLAFQEQTIAELNTALTDQQQQLNLLRLELKFLKEKFGALEEKVEVGAPQDERPPHY